MLVPFESLREAERGVRHIGDIDGDVQFYS